jgi:hypothetical protein
MDTIRAKEVEVTILITVSFCIRSLREIPRWSGAYVKPMGLHILSHMNGICFGLVAAVKLIYTRV